MGQAITSHHSPHMFLFLACIFICFEHFVTSSFFLFGGGWLCTLLLPPLTKKTKKTVISFESHAQLVDIDNFIVKIENRLSGSAQLIVPCNISLLVGNKAVQSKLYSDAIELYTFAIALCEDNAVYHCNRCSTDEIQFMFVI